jgi:hypothetical protein
MMALGKGMARIFRIAFNSSFRGYFSMEWDTVGDPYQGTRRLIAESLENLGKEQGQKPC